MSTPIPLHLLPDDEDYRRDIGRRKKYPMVVVRPAPPPPQQVHEDIEHLRQDVIIPCLVRSTTSSREGCAPNSPRFEVCPSTHTLRIEQLATVRDLSSLLWDFDDSGCGPQNHANTPPLLMQKPNVTPLLLLDAKNSRKLVPPCRNVLWKSDVLTILPQLEALTTVVIRNNFCLEVLPLEALHQIRNLKHLDLSYNALRHLPCVTFLKPSANTRTGTTSAFPDLLELLLDNNELSWVPREIFTAMPRLQRLTVNNNLLAGMPSTLGNHCVPGATLTVLSLHNNVVSKEGDDVEETAHSAAHYDVLISKTEEHLERLGAGGSLTRERERDLFIQYQRMPMRRPCSSTTCQVYTEGTRVLLHLLRKERLWRDAKNDWVSRGAADAFYSGPTGWALEVVRCNMCQVELFPLWERYRNARAALVASKEVAALGPRYRPPKSNHDFSFFMDGDSPKQRPLFEYQGDDAHTKAPWERDEELLWMIGEALNGGFYGASAERVLGAAPQSAMDSGCPPFCSVNYVDVAKNKDVPLLYFMCGSDMCQRSLAEMSVEGNATQNFSRVDYSKLDPSDDDD